MVNILIGENMVIKIDYDKIIGKIKPMHGVGQPPFVGSDFSTFKYLKEAGIPYSRLHDVGGAYGEFRWVDVPNIFRDFNADPYKEENYDFVFTDMLITSLFDNGVEPIFRLGVTIENDAKIKAYRIFPPVNYDKWAVICEHIIKHYTEGWANGFNYNINYWEIWNEPDNFEEISENQMWKGTKEEFFEFYKTASKHLKKCFPHLKIGGYGSCGFYDIKKSYIANAKSSPRFEYFIEFFDEFLKFIKKENCPLDFFSWHSYDYIENNLVYAEYARKRLNEFGFSNTETMCNEWNVEPNRAVRGTYRHASLIEGMMISFQNSPLDSAMFYDARIGTSVYGGLFNPITFKPYPAYYSFVAYNKLYELGNQVPVEGAVSPVYAMCSVKDNFGRILIVNTSAQDLPMTIDSDINILRKIIIADNKNYEEIEDCGILPAFSVITVEFEFLIKE